MESRKVLFVSQEITPYIAENRLSRIGRYLPREFRKGGRR